MDICLSFAAYVHKTHVDSAKLAKFEFDNGLLTEPRISQISLKHIQLVPQARNKLSFDEFEEVKKVLPESTFRLHANTRVLDKHQMVDLSDFSGNEAYFEALAEFSNEMKAPAYSVHSGHRKAASFEQILINRDKVQKMFDCPVAIEPQYPSSKNLLISSWADHRKLLKAKVPFALDLSHLNIVARFYKRLELELVQEMLSSEYCLEVHVSDNDGKSDAHQVHASEAWWEPLLKFVNPKAVVFTEGSRFNQIRSYQSRGQI